MLDPFTLLGYSFPPIPPRRMTMRGSLLLPPSDQALVLRLLSLALINLDYAQNRMARRSPDSARPLEARVAA